MLLALMPGLYRLQNATKRPIKAGTELEGAPQRALSIGTGCTPMHAVVVELSILVTAYTWGHLHSTEKPLECTLEKVP